MTFRRGLRPLAFFALFVLPAPAMAQGSRLLLTEGIAAHNDLEYVAAARLLTRALSGSLKPALVPAERARAHMYLGSCHVNQGDRSAAVNAFRSLVIEAPRFKPDSLIFPPAVTSLFTETVQTTKAVAVETPEEQTIAPGTRAAAFRVWASSPHQVAATLFLSGNDSGLVLYEGPIEDSISVSWTPRPVAASYRLEIASKLSATAVVRTLVVPLETQLTQPPAAAIPPTEPAPEKSPEPVTPVPGAAPRRSGPAVAALVGGVVMGGLLLVAPRDGARVAGVTLAVGGAVGFFLLKPGRPRSVGPAPAAKPVAGRAAASPPAVTRAAEPRLVITAGPREVIER